MPYEFEIRPGYKYNVAILLIVLSFVGDFFLILYDLPFGVFYLLAKIVPLLFMAMESAEVGILDELEGYGWTQKNLPLGIAVGVPLGIIMVMVSSVITAIGYPAQLYVPVMASAGMFGIAVVSPTLLAVSSSALQISVVVGEESLFRGFMGRYSTMFTGSKWAGALMQASIFSIIHGVVAYAIDPAMIGAFISAFVFGIVAYWAFYYIGTIFCPIVMHYTYNTIVILWAAGVVPLTGVSLAILGVFAAIIIASILIVTRRVEL